MKKLLITVMSALSVGGLFFSVPVQAVTLREAIMQVVHHNPQVSVIGHVRRAADHEVRQARAGYFATVDVHATYGREHTNSVSNVPPKNTLNNSRFGISLRQPIFDGFLTHNEMYRTKSKANAEAFLQEGAAQDFALRTTESYLNLLRDKALMRIANRRLQAHRRIYRMVKDRSTSGISRKAQTNQVLTRLEAAKADYLSARSNLLDQQTLFHRLTGAFPTQGAKLPVPNSSYPSLLPSQISLVEPPLPSHGWLPNSEVELVNIALENDPIIKSAYQDIQEAKGQEYSARSRLYPTLDFVLGANHNNNISGTRGRDDDSFAMLEANYNLFRGGHDVARVDETVAEYNEALDIHRNSIRESSEKARLTWNAYVETRKKMGPLKKRKVEAANTVKAYMEQFRLGKRTLVDLLNAENDVFHASVAYVDNLYKYKFSLFRILNSENKLLAFFHVPLPLTATHPHHLPHQVYHRPTHKKAVHDHQGTRHHKHKTEHLSHRLYHHPTHAHTVKTK